MKDPCQECDNLEKRDQFLRQSGLSLTEENESQNRMILRQSFTEFQEDNLKYKHLFETAPDAVFIADVESGLILDANESAAKLLGIPIDEIIGMHQSKLHPPEETERYRKIFQEHIQKKTAIFSDNIYVCRKDGHEIPVQINAAVTQIDGKKIIYGIFRDMTEKMELTRNLKSSEVRFKRLAEAAFEAIAIHAHEEVIDVNQQFLKMFGYETLEEVKKKPGLNFYAPQSRALVLEKMASGYEGIYDAFGMKKDGTLFPVQIQAKETFLDGEPIRIGAIRDMTNELWQEQLFKTVFESSHECIIVFDQACNYRYANQAALDYVDLPYEKVVGINIFDVWPNDPDFAKQWAHRIKETFKTGKSSRFEDTSSIAEQPVYSESVISPIRYPGGGMFAVSIVYRDMTEQKQLQQKIADSEKRYRILYKNAQVALYRTRMSDGQLLACNQSTASLFGYADEIDFLASHCTIKSYVNQKDRDRLLERLNANNRVQGFEVQLSRKDGTSFWASISAQAFPEQDYIEGVMSDITATKYLTKSEKKVLDQLMRGKSNKEIAKALRRSVRTIEDHRAHIMRKLGVDNLVDLAQKALNLPAHHLEE